MRTSAVLNLTQAETFTEFVHEIRAKRLSHVLFLPQYAEPYRLRVVQTVLDIIHEYPEFPEGWRRWDERTFHPNSAGAMRPIWTLWQRTPYFIQAVLAGFRLFEVDSVRRTLQKTFGTPAREFRFSLDEGQ